MGGWLGIWWGAGDVGDSLKGGGTGKEWVAGAMALDLGFKGPNLEEWAR